MKIVFIGAGNLATSLAMSLKKNGFEISQVYSRTKRSAVALANLTGSEFTNSVKNIRKDGNLYITALSDNAIIPVLDRLTFTPALLVHTSGSTDMNVLKKYAEKFGVIYPVQTFKKNKITGLHDTPFCIEAGDRDTEKKLAALVRKISCNVRVTTSGQRLKIHLAAVFACNFTNHMFTVADNILKEENISFTILKPLIEETMDNAYLFSPVNAQTGPAVRNDRLILDKHKEMLGKNTLPEKIYRFVSKSILNSKHE